MQTTTAEYKIEVITDEGCLSFIRTMPTKPKTSKGRNSHIAKLGNYAKKQYPNWTNIKVTTVN